MILTSIICHLGAYLKEFYQWCSFLISPKFVRIFTGCVQYTHHGGSDIHSLLTAKFPITLLHMSAGILLINLVIAVFSLVCNEFKNHNWTLLV